MVKVVFKYKDEYTHGQWRTQEGTYESLDQCVKMNGLDECKYEIVSITTISKENG